MLLHLVIFRYTACTQRGQNRRGSERRRQFWQVPPPSGLTLTVALVSAWMMTMFSVRDTTIDTSIAVAKFGCDLAQCRGGCCTMPGPRGAPLLEEEIEEIQKAFPVIRKYLSEEHLGVIEARGVVERFGGENTTTCVDHRACVFVTYENGIAKCAFEKAFFNKETSWRKPISCHLFPIRVDRGFHDHLRYESIPECVPALRRGENERLYLSDFLRDALVRLYGEEWFREFTAACASERESVLAQTMKYQG
jgi:hypothetical protein